MRVLLRRLLLEGVLGPSVGRAPISPAGPSGATRKRASVLPLAWIREYRRRSRRYWVLLDGDEIETARLTRLGLMADDQIMWMGFVGRGDLERARLRALLDAGVITQKEFDRAYEETLEQTTGTVEKKDN